MSTLTTNSPSPSGARPKRAPLRRPPRSVRATLAKVTAISLAVAALIAGGLATQMAAGRDPALAPKAQRLARAKAASQPPPGGVAQAPAPAPAPVVTRTS